MNEEQNTQTQAAPAHAAPAHAAPAHAAPAGAPDTPTSETVTVSRADLEAMVRQLEENTEPSQAEIEAAMQRLQTMRNANGSQRGGQGDVPAINANGNAGGQRAGDPAVEVNQRYVWQRRAIRVFNALVAERTEGRRESEQRLAAIEEEVRQMPQRQLAHEESEARTIIQESGLTRAQQHRVSFAIDLPETRLHTTSTSDTPKAGFLLPKPFLAELLVLMEEYGVVRRTFRPIPMTADKIDLKNVISKVITYWTGEGVNFTASDLQLSEGILEVKKLAGITSLTSELDEDAAIPFLPTLLQLFAESASQREDQAGIVGDGTATYGSFTGLLNLPNAIVITLAAGKTTMGDVDEDDVRRVKSALSKYRRQGARWFMNEDLHDHISKLENGAGFRIFQSMIVDEGPGRLLGYNIETAEVMPESDAAAGTPIAVYGNSNNAFMGQRRGMVAETSREAVLQAGDGSIAYNAFQADGQLIKVSSRVGFAVAEALQEAFVILKLAAA